jgi:hypothetical protein
MPPGDAPEQRLHLRLWDVVEHVEGNGGVERGRRERDLQDVGVEEEGSLRRHLLRVVELDPREVDPRVPPADRQSSGICARTAADLQHVRIRWNPS